MKRRIVRHVALLVVLAPSGAAAAQTAVIRPAAISLSASALVRVDTTWVTIVRGSDSTAAGIQIDHVALLDGGSLRHVTTLDRGGRISVDTNTYRATNLAPLTHYSTGGGRVFSLTYLGDSALGIKQPEAGPAERFSVRVAEPVFDASAMDLLLEVLPLRDGYTARIPFFNHEKANVVWTRLRVVGVEPVARAGGRTRMAWHVVREFEAAEAPVVHSWISVAGGRLIRTMMEPAPGVQVIGVR